VGAEQPVGVVLYPLGARLAARFLGWLGTRLTDHIDKVSMSGDALVRSEASKHRHAVAQVPTWIAIVLVYRVTVVLIIDRLGIQPKPVTGGSGGGRRRSGGCGARRRRCSRVVRLAHALAGGGAWGLDLEHGGRVQVEYY